MSKFSTEQRTFPDCQAIPLGPAEELLWRAEQWRDGAFRVTVLLWLDGCIEADILAVALRQLQRRHPKLRAVITQGDDGRHRFLLDETAPPIPFEITDHDGAEFPWREETRRLLQIGFGAEGPLAGVSVLRSRSRGRSQLILTVHHAIADGLSGLMLMDDLLIEYANAEGQFSTPARPSLPLITATHAPSRGWWNRLWLLRRIIRLQREERRGHQTPLPEGCEIPPQSQWVHWVFSREDTLQLVRRCRKERASLGGVVIAAVCCGLMDCLPVSGGVFKCQFPFDLRTGLQGAAGPVTRNDLGCFTSIMNAFYSVPQQPAFWDVARHVHREVDAFVQQGGPSFNYNLAAALASPLFARAASRLWDSNDKRVTLLATNYGVINLRDVYGSLRPEGCTLIFKSDNVGPSLVMEALVLRQQLNIGFSADQLDSGFWERLQEAVRRYLNTAAAE